MFKGIKYILITLLFLGVVFSFYYLIISPKKVESKQTESPLAALEKKEKISKKNNSKKSLDSLFESEIEYEYLSGAISIPTINKTLKIYSIAEEPYITYGVGLDIEGRVLGKDNYVLASHDYSNTFGELINVNVGDIIYVLENKKLFTFVVSEKFFADNNNVQSIKSVRENEKEPLLTLYTCLGEEGTTIRTVVKATLKGEKSIDNSNKEIKELFSTNGK